MDILALIQKKSEQLPELALTYGPKILVAILIVIIGRIIVRKLSNKTVTASQKIPNIDLTLARFFGSMVLISGTLFVFIMALSALNINLAFIATIVGAMVLALGFALQESLGDLASGVMLAFFRPYKIDDEVQINGERGKVKSLDIFTTTLVTVDNVEMTVGNGDAFGNIIKNYNGYGDLRLDMDFGVSYDANLDDAIKAIKSVAEGDARIHQNPAPWAKVTTLGDSAVTIQLRLWCDAGHYRAIKMDISQRVKNALDKAGIDIPYEHCMIIPMKAK